MGWPVPQRQRATGSAHEGLSHDTPEDPLPHSLQRSTNTSRTPEPETCLVSAPKESVSTYRKTKRIKTQHIYSFPTQVQSTARNFTEIPLELKLMILEYFEAESLLALWMASSEFHRLFKQDYGLKFWDQIRQSSGLSPPEAPELPTQDELYIMLYVLKVSCQECRFGNASHQWPWGIRLCRQCLLPRLITRYDFVMQFRELFENKRSAFEAIVWVNPIDIPGLESSPMATKYLNAPSSEKGHLVAFRPLADKAVQEVQRLEREQPTRSEDMVSRDVKRILLAARSAHTDGLHRIQQTLEDSHQEVSRVGVKREKQIIPRLFQMKHLQLRNTDIPDATDPEWRSLVYKGTEMTAREWHNIQAPLVQLVKQRQVDRLSAILETYPLPTPASMAAPAYDQGPENAESLIFDVFPASVFLKVCANADLETIANVEKTSKLARAVLRSRDADPTWRIIRISLGLEARFEHWPERAFLAYAIRRRCYYCSQEDLNIPLLSLVLCGDCFESHVVKDIGMLRLPKAVLKAIAFIQNRPFSTFGWIETSKQNAKLYRTSYVQSMSLWIQNLPTDVKNCMPQELIQKHVARHTDSFIKVAKQCEAWQKVRDPENTRLINRREEALLRRVDREGSALGIPGHVFQSEGWRNVADKAYPLSDREWNKVKKRVLDIVREHQVIGGVRIANLR